MFVPIVFSISPISPANWLSDHFLQALSFAEEYQTPFISQECYSDLDTSDHLSILIPKDIENSFISGFPSETDAYLSSLTEDWPEIEDYIIQRLLAAQRKSGKKVKALLNFNDNQFIRNVAKKLGCSVMHYEFSAIREPNYNRTLYYWDYKGLYGKSDMQERYAAFLADDRHRFCPVLTRKELLALFLKKEDLDYLKYGGENAPFDIGVASKGFTINGTFPYNKVNDAEMIHRAMRIFGAENILYKSRFSIMHGEVIEVATGQMAVHKANLFDFLIKSKRVLCAGSNIAFDAAMFGRPVYDVGWSNNSIVSNNDFESMRDCMPSDELLSFMIFSGFIPKDLFWTEQYLNYIMSNPSEVELYRFHFRYYCESFGLDEEFVSFSSAERMKAITESKGLDYDEFKQRKVQTIAKDADRIYNQWVCDSQEDTAKSIIFDTSWILDSRHLLHQEIRLPAGCRSIRWYPCKCMCGIKDVTFLNEKGKSLGITSHNGRDTGTGEILFLTEDPVIEIQIDPSSTTRIRIEAGFRYLTEDDHIYVLNGDKVYLQNENANLEIVLLDSQQNVERLSYANAHLLGEIKAMEESTSWRITAPMRKLMRLFRK